MSAGNPYPHSSWCRKVPLQCLEKNHLKIASFISMSRQKLEKGIEWICERAKRIKERWKKIACSYILFFLSPFSYNLFTLICAKTSHSKRKVSCRPGRLSRVIQHWEFNSEIVQWNSVKGISMEILKWKQDSPARIWNSVFIQEWNELFCKLFCILLCTQI